MSTSKYIYVLFCFWSLFLVPFLLIGQLSLHFEKITTFDGLPDMCVRDICEDSLGFIWFSTSAGIVKYDGYNCLPVTRMMDGKLDKSPYLPANKLYCDRAGAVWVNQLNNGLYRCTKDSYFLERYDLSWIDSSLNKCTIIAISGDEKGWIWISTTEKHVLGFSPKEKKYINLTDEFGKVTNKQERKFILNIRYNPVFQSIWFVDDAHNLFELDSFRKLYVNTFKDLEGALKLPKCTISTDLDGSIWIGGYGTGLVHFDPRTKRWKQWNKDKNIASQLIKHFVQNAEGDLYLVFDGGYMQYYKPTNNVFKNIYAEDDNAKSDWIPNSSILFICSKSNLWVGDVLTGVAVSYQQSSILTTVSPKAQLKIPTDQISFLNIMQADSVSAFVGSDGYGLFRFTPDKIEFSIVPIPNLSERKVVKTMYNDKPNGFWFGHWLDGFSYASPFLEWKNYSKNTQGPFQALGLHAWGFCRDKENNLWVAFLDAGLVQYDSSGNVLNRYLYDQDSNVLFSEVLDVLCDYKGTIWVATSCGLGYLRKNSTKFEWFQLNGGVGSQAFPIDQIRCLFEDDAHNLWVGTQGAGLFVFKEGKFRQFTSDDGLLSNDIQAIVKGKNGCLFASSYIGITEFSYQNEKFDCLRRFSTNKKNVLNHKALCFFNEQTLMAGGQHGLSYIHFNEVNKGGQAAIGQVKFSKINLKTSLDESLVLNETQRFFKNHQLVLEQEDAFVSILLSSNDLSCANQTVYAYRIIEMTENWTTLSYGGRELMLAGLSPGTYHIEVKCRSKNATWSPVRSFQVNVTQAFWKSKAFLMAFSLLFITLLAGYIIVHLRQRNLIVNRKLLELERSKLLEDRSNLTNQVEIQTSEMMVKSVEMARKTDLIVDLKDQLSGLGNLSETERSHKLRTLARSLDNELKGGEEWEQFRMYFDRSNADFTNKLQKKHPGLTQNDVRLAVFIRMNMETQEIANLLNITAGGVRKARYRLKKRLNYNSEEELHNYIIAFEGNK